MKRIFSTTLFFIFANLLAFYCHGQTDSTLSKSYRGYFAKHSFFAYYDFVRQVGLGYTYSSTPYFDISIQAGYINPIIHRTISGSNDFYFKKGFSINACPKFFLTSLKGIYIGPIFSYQNLSYKNKWVEQINGYNKYYADYKARSDLKSQGFAFQFCVGTKHNFKHLNFETFLSIGAEINYDKRTWYEVNRKLESVSTGLTYPHTFKETSGGFIGTLGIRIGFSKNYKKVTRRRFLNKYVYTKLLNPKIGKLYKEKKITKEQIKEYSAKKREISSELNVLYKKNFLHEKILIEESNKIIDSFNAYIKSNFPSE